MKNNEQKKQNAQSSANKETLLPILLVTVCLTITAIAFLIEKFIGSFGGDLLSPLLAQIIAFFIPAYLCLLLTSPGKSAKDQLKSIGFGRLRAEYIFFIVFSALLLCSTSFIVNVIFGGVYPASEGFTLLGTFTAGVGEYSVSIPYLMVVYAIFPAIIEELLFRGLLYNLFAKLGEDVAIILSTLSSAFFAFSLGGLPAALLCGGLYCFIRYTTGTLQSCMIVHFIFNLYALFIQTNLSKYFLSSQNNLLLIIIIIIFWLVSLTLFFTESARVFRSKAEKIASKGQGSAQYIVDPKSVIGKLKAVFSYRPSLILAIVSAFIFISITVIGYFA